MSIARKIAWLVVAAVGLAGAAAAQACSVPVFRYALERWPADSYQILLFHRGPLPKGERVIADALGKAVDSKDAYLNLELRLVDVAAKMEDEDAQFWKMQKNATLPWVVLRYPQAPPQVRPAWAGPLNASEVKGLLDSPVRRQLASRLLKGEAVVWLLIESGDQKKDEAAQKLLAEQLPRLEKTLELPKVDPNDPDIPGPKLRSSLPLRLAFSSIRVSRKDPAEKVLISTLLEGHREVPVGPIIVPVFGRGRALTLIGGKDLDAENLAEAAKFLIGECSCQVKELNPGIDILLAADWDALVDDEKPKNPKLPIIP